MCVCVRVILEIGWAVMFSLNLSFEVVFIFYFISHKYCILIFNLAYMSVKLVMEMLYLKFLYISLLFATIYISLYIN